MVCYYQRGNACLHSMTLKLLQSELWWWNMKVFPLYSPELNLCIFSLSSTASNSPRSTPGSSPSLRRRVLGGGRASENEGGGEKSSGGGGGGGSDSPLPSIPSASSITSAYPLASRHFSRNAKVTQNSHHRVIFSVIQQTCRHIEVKTFEPVVELNTQYDCCLVCWRKTRISFVWSQMFTIMIEFCASQLHFQIKVWKKRIKEHTNSINAKKFSLFNFMLLKYQLDTSHEPC